MTVFKRTLKWLSRFDMLFVGAAMKLFAILLILDGKGIGFAYYILGTVFMVEHMIYGKKKTNVK